MSGLPLAGRAEELDAIALAWQRLVADPERPATVVITGEAGVGKSRLVAAALSELDPAPLCVLAGQARSHAPAPYDWVASALNGRPLDGLPAPADALAWLTQRPSAPTRRFAPGALLRVAVDAIRAVVGGGPAVLVVEDLHDLDPASLALVADLTAAHPLPALIVVTSRPPDEAAFPELAARVLTRVSGAPRSIRRHLVPLSPAEVAAVVAAGFDSVPAPEVVLAAHRRTGGNPFWISELITAYRGSGPAALAEALLPDHVAALVTERLAGSAGAVVRVARAAALIGDEFAVDELVRVSADQVDAATVEAAVRTLVELRLLTLGPGGEPRFRYPVFREAVAGTALAVERAEVHRAARSLAIERADDTALARHALAVGQPAEAASAGLRAATAQLAAGAPAEALAVAELGLRASGLDSAADSAPAGSVPPAESVLALLRIAVESATAAGEFAAADRYASRWRRLARDPADQVAAHHASAEVAWHLGHTEEQRAQLDAAAKLLEPDRPADGWARQLAAEAHALLGAGQLAAAAALADEALAAEPALTGALVTRALAAAGRDDDPAPSEGPQEAVREALRLAEERRDLVAMARAVDGLAGSELNRLTERAAWRAFDEALSTLARHGLERRAGRVIADGVRLAVRCGDLERARALAAARAPIEPDATERIVLTALGGLVAVEAGDDAAAILAWERVEAEATDVDRSRARRHADYLGVVVAARTGGADEAIQALDGYQRRHSRGIADAARWALRAGAPAGRVRALAGGAVDARLQCALLAAEGADEEAVATEIAQHSRAAWRAADTHLVLAQCLLRLGRTDEARGHAERATVLLRRWPGWRRDEAAAILTAVRSGRELTTREREVLSCVAAGMTNQQVARSLGISIRTVTVHVSNLLRKTGSASRTEAALWAVRNGLATPT